MLSLKKKVNIIFYQILAIGFGFLAIGLFLTINLYSKLVLIGKSLFGQLKTACGCAKYLVLAEHPFISSFILLSALGLTFFLIFAVVKIFKLHKSTANFINFNLKKRKNSLSPKLAKAAHNLGLNNQIVEINGHLPVIFCFGFIKPKICISHTVVAKLSLSELKAVLCHESHHMSAYEPAKIFISKIIAKTLFFLPGIKLLNENYITLSELAADEQATRYFKNKMFLAGALQKIMRLKEQLTLQKNLAISFFSVIDERVNKLADENYTPHFKIFAPKLLLFATLIILFIFSFTLPLNASQTNVFIHTDNVCLTPETSSKLMDEKCQMSLNKQECLMHNNSWLPYTACDKLP